MRRAFVTVDVFTSRRFAGNPLAVVLEPDGLEQTVMQTIAREFNFPETVFVLPPAASSNRARVRIFTPATELPFAGHPTIGTAVVLGRIDGGEKSRGMVLEEGIGPVRCQVEPIGCDHGRARFDVLRLPEEAGPAADRTAIAGALQLEPGDIGFDRFEPSRFSAGNPFTFVPVRGLDAIRRCRPDPATFEKVFGGSKSALAYIFCAETIDAGSAYHARMFAPSMGIPEDPATGSAAAAFPGVLNKFCALADGEHKFVLEQGYEMGRPSLITINLTLNARKLTAATVGGDAVIVTEGTIEA